MISRLVEVKDYHGVSEAFRCGFKSFWSAESVNSRSDAISGFMVRFYVVSSRAEVITDSEGWSRALNGS